MQGVGKALASHLGETQCQLLPCPGWDCGALFPTATLRLEGNWSVYKPPPAREQHPACAALPPSSFRQKWPVLDRRVPSVWYLPQWSTDRICPILPSFSGLLVIPPSPQSP